MISSLIKGFLLIIVVSWSVCLTPVDPAPARRVDYSCQRGCASTYGEELGKYKGVKGFSNCSYKCANGSDSDAILRKEDTGLSQNIYTGMKWQCVEYARRFLVINLEVTFASIGSAYEIYNLNSVQSVRNPSLSYRFLSFPNGSVTPPIEGDLIIHAKSYENHFGHVAVVAEVDLNNGFVALAEQNQRNYKWDNPQKYARKIKLIKCNNDQYVVIDSEVQWGETCHDKGNILGWKRVSTTRKNFTVYSSPDKADSIN